MASLDPYLDEIKEALAGNASQRDLAKRYGVARSTVQSFMQKNGLESRPPDGAVPAEAVSETELMEAELRDLRARVRRERLGDVVAERLMQEVQAAVAAAPPVFEPLPPVLEKEHHGHVQALLLSDLHGGEVVDPEAMDGLNEFHWDILVSRMQHIHRSLVSYQQARSYPIDELNLWWLGDMCSGANHEELAITNEFPQAEQAFRVGMLLGKFTEQLIPHYPRIRIAGVSGNHPRTSKAPAAKHVFDNFDWLAYKIAETYLHNYIEQGTVEVYFPLAGQALVDIAGMRFFLFHGDGIRSSMVGFPGGGVTRRCKELKTQWLEKGTVVNGFALGHFHSAHVLPGNVFVNGSVKGPDEWCLKQFGYASPPEQLLLTFDPRKQRRTDVSSITP